MIELDQLLSENCTPEQVSEFFKNGEFYEEHNSIAAIKKYLLTKDNRQALSNMDLSIEECLNGRFPKYNEEYVNAIFNEWNAKLGFRHFGF